MDRRNFTNLMAVSSFSYLFLKLTGCGPTQGHTLGSDDTVAAPDDGVVMVYDTVLKGWSVLGSGFLGDCGILKATQVKENKTITLDYEQDDHGHKFTLTPEHFAKLLKGQVVEMMTTEAQGHHHKVVIDPKNRVPGSQAIAIPLNPNQPQQPAEQLFAKLPEQESPNLYVAATTDLEEGSVQYCVDTAERCDADQTLWQAMTRHAPRVDKQIFVSQRSLNLDVTRREQMLLVRGKDKKNAQLLRFMLKLINQKP